MLTAEDASIKYLILIETVYYTGQSLFFKTYFMKKIILLVTVGLGPVILFFNTINRFVEVSEADHIKKIILFIIACIWLLAILFYTAMIYREFKSK